MHRRQMREPFKPVRPRFTYFMSGVISAATCPPRSASWSHGRNPPRLPLIPLLRVAEEAPSTATNLECLIRRKDRDVAFARRSLDSHAQRPARLRRPLPL